MLGRWEWEVSGWLQVYFRGVGKCSKIEVKVAQLGESFKNHLIVQSKWVDYMAWEIYFNQAVAKQNKNPEAPRRLLGWSKMEGMLYE